MPAHPPATVRSSAPGPVAHLRAALTAIWNDPTTNPSMADWVATLMLVECGVKPAATSLRSGAPARDNGGPYDQLANCFRAAGRIVRIVPGDGGGPEIVVARTVDAADRLCLVLAAWTKAGERWRIERHWIKLTRELGLALGYPLSAVEAFLGIRPALRGDLPPWSPSERGWWDEIRAFVPAADEAGLAEARAWLTRAVAAFKKTYPAAKAPTPKP